MKNKLFTYLILQMLLLTTVFHSAQAQAITPTPNDSIDFVLVFPNETGVDSIIFRKELLKARELACTYPSGARLWRLPKTLNHIIDTMRIVYNFSISTSDSTRAADEVKRKVKSVAFGANKKLISQGTTHLLNDTIGFSRCQYSVEQRDLALSAIRQRDSIKIGILDSGVDPQFSGTISHRWNFVGWNDTINDDNGHGNFISNIIHNQLDSNIAKYSIFKILDNTGTGYLFDVIRAIDKSIILKLDVCNLSIITSHPILPDTIKNPLQIAMDTAAAHQLILVCAAGNDSIDIDLPHNNYLASYNTPSNIKVLSIDCNNRLLEGSNFGKKQVDIGAYGREVVSLGRYNQMEYGQGTSYATAKVTAAVAKLLLSMPSFPNFAEDCKNAIVQGRRELLSLNDKCISGGAIYLNGAWKILNLYDMTLDDLACNNQDTIWLKLSMKARRDSIDALTAYIYFDSTQVQYLHAIQRGNALPTDAIVANSCEANKRIKITIDLAQSSISGDSNTWLLSVPFRLQPAFALPNNKVTFRLKLEEERINRKTIIHRSTYNFTIKPNNSLIIGVTNNSTNIPLSISLGNICDTLNRHYSIPNTHSFNARRDSFSHFELKCITPTTPLVRGYDIFMMKHKDSFSLTPYQRIAADVNHDDSIKNDDIIILTRRAILTYSGMYLYSSGRLNSDCLFIKDSNFRNVNRCYALVNSSNTICDTVNIAMQIIELGNVKKNDSYSFNNNVSIYIDFSRRQRVANEWKIPIYSNILFHSFDLQFRNINISPSLLRMEVGNTDSLVLSYNNTGIGQNFYAIAYSKKYAGILSNSSNVLAYLYMNVSERENPCRDLANFLGNEILAYVDTQRVNVYKDVCLSTDENKILAVNVFPNPCNDYLQVSFTTPIQEFAIGKIYDLLGRCLSTFFIEPNTSNMVIDTKNIMNGAFILSIGNFKTKIIKNKY